LLVGNSLQNLTPQCCGLSAGCQGNRVMLDYSAYIIGTPNLEPTSRGQFQCCQEMYQHCDEVWIQTDDVHALINQKLSSYICSPSFAVNTKPTLWIGTYNSFCCRLKEAVKHDLTILRYIYSVLLFMETLPIIYIDRYLNF